MNAKLLNPSKFLSGTDLPVDTTFTIKAITIEDIENDKGKVDRKGQFILAEADKPWLANVTNTKCLIAMFGDETDRWLGKRVTLFAERVQAFGEWHLGARVRGSPDITSPVSVRVKLRKKKEQVMTLVPTGGQRPAPTPPAPPTVVTFGKQQGWKDKPIASFDSQQLSAIVEEGERMCAANPKENWVRGVQACLTAIRAELERRVTAEPPEADAP